MAPAANTNLALLEIRGAAAEMFTARAIWGTRVIAEASRENMIVIDEEMANLGVSSRGIEWDSP